MHKNSTAAHNHIPREALLNAINFSFLFVLFLMGRFMRSFATLTT